MDGDRTHRALLRIDSALARLEAIALQPVPAKPTRERPTQDEGDIAQRHARLRAAVTQTLGQLDLLIESHDE